MKEGIGLPFLLYSPFFSYMFYAAACLLRLSAQLICCKRRTQIRRATRKQLQENFFSWIRINSHPATRCSAQHWQWEGEQREREETVGGQLTSLILANCERCSLLSVWHHRQLPLTRNDTNSESENETEMCKWAQRAYLKQHSEDGGEDRGESTGTLSSRSSLLAPNFISTACRCNFMLIVVVVLAAVAPFVAAINEDDSKSCIYLPPHPLTVIRCLPPFCFFA